MSLHFRRRCQKHKNKQENFNLSKMDLIDQKIEALRKSLIEEQNNARKPRHDRKRNRSPGRRMMHQSRKRHQTVFVKTHSTYDENQNVVGEANPKPPNTPPVIMPDLRAALKDIRGATTTTIANQNTVKKYTFSHLIKTLNQRPVGNLVKQKIKKLGEASLPEITYWEYKPNFSETLTWEKRLSLFLIKTLEVFYIITDCIFNEVDRAETLRKIKQSGDLFTFSRQNDPNDQLNIGGFLLHTPNYIKTTNCYGQIIAIRTGSLALSPDRNLCNYLQTLFEQDYITSPIEKKFHIKHTNLCSFHIWDMTQLLDFLFVISEWPAPHQKIIYSSLANVFSKSRKCKMTLNIKQSLRPSSFKTYFNHLNILQNYFLTTSDMSNIPTQQKTKNALLTHFSKITALDQIQKKVILPEHIWSLIIWMKAKYYHANYIAGVFNGLNFFFKKFQTYDLNTYPPLKESKKNLRRHFRIETRGADPLTLDELKAYVEFLEENRSQYGGLAEITQLGAAFCTRTNEIFGAKFSEFEKVIMKRSDGGQEIFLSLHIEKTKNSNIPVQKTVKIDANMLFNPLKALQKLKKRSSATNDQIYFDWNSRLPKTLSQAFDEVRHSFDELKKLVQTLQSKKLSFYSIRSGMIVIFYLFGLKEEQIKTISKHSPKSKVLKQSYMSKLANYLDNAHSTVLKLLGTKQNSDHLKNWGEKIDTLKTTHVHKALKTAQLFQQKLQNLPNPEIGSLFTETTFLQQTSGEGIEDLLPRKNNSLALFNDDIFTKPLEDILAFDKDLKFDSVDDSLQDILNDPTLQLLDKAELPSKIDAKLKSLREKLGLEYDTLMSYIDNSFM